MPGAYEALVQIAEEEMPEIGAYALEKQMRDIGISPETLEADHIPEIARHMAEVASMFGTVRARSMRKRILSLVSVSELYSEKKSPEHRVQTLVEIGYSAYFSGEWDEAIRNLEMAREIALNHGFSRKVVEIDMKMARILSRKKDFEYARSLLKEAGNVLEKIGDRDLKAELFYEKGAVSWWSGDEEDAIKNFKRSLDVAKILGDQRLMGLAYMGMANAYCELGDIEKDLEYSMKALNYFEKSDAKEEIAKMYTNIGVTYEDMGNLRDAENYYLLCVEYSRSIGYLLTEAWAYLNLSELYIRMGDYWAAEEYAKNALEAYEEMKDNVGIALAKERFAMVYSAKGDYEEAAVRFEESIRLKERYDTPYGMAVTLCRYGKMLYENGNPDGKAKVREASRIFREIGNDKKAEECESFTPS